MVCPVELQDWALDDLPTLSRAILRGALCLDGIRFPDDNDPTSRALDPPPPVLRLHNSADSWSPGKRSFPYAPNGTQLPAGGEYEHAHGGRVGRTQPEQHQ